MSREYAVSNLPKNLTFNGGWNCEPPFTDELQKHQPGSFGNLLRELVAKEKIIVNVVKIKAMSNARLGIYGATEFCVKHGGGKRCQFEGCKTAAHGATAPARCIYT